MFGNKNDNDRYANYNNDYTNYNNGYSEFGDDNYNSYGNNNYQQGYNNNYQNNYDNMNYQNSSYNNSQYTNNYDSYDNSYNTSYTNNYNNYGSNQNDSNYGNDSYNTGYLDTMAVNNQLNAHTGYLDTMAVNNQLNAHTGYLDTMAINNQLSNNSYTDSYQNDYSDVEEVFDDYVEEEFVEVEDVIDEPEEYGDDTYYSEEGYFVNPIQPSNSHAMLTKIIAMASVCIIGLLCGSLTDTALKNFWLQNIESDSMLIEGVKVLGIILYTYVVSSLHIIIHELGHYIGGIVTDYSAVCFRVFGITFVKDGSKTKVKRYSVPGTAGECTMMPPEIVNGKYPYMLYSFGGIIMNLVTSLVALVIASKVGFAKVYPYSMMFIVFAIIGFITILYNGIPLIINGIPNDGYTLMHMFKSKDARIAVHSHLLINAYLARGGRYSDIPFEQFYRNAGGNYSGHLWVKVKLMEYRWHLEHMDFAKAAECINILDYSFKKLPRVYQYEINSEKMFLEMMGSNDTDIVEKLYSIDVKNYLEDTLGMMSSLRVMMAYEACVTGNLKAANKYYNLLKNAVKSEPLKGESDLELMLGTYIYERFCLGQ